ncbi:MAG: ATP-grasp domain-containing protein [Actinomycetota bacterium]|nr:ATP-grasp domain-containing protein [Actinomycetota bacterium]
MVREELDRLEVQHVTFDQRRFEDMDMGFGVSEAGVAGWLRIGQRSYRLEDFSAVYTRVIDEQILPELRGEPPRSLRRLRARALTETLTRWYEVAPARVVNRSGPMGSNASKPYQAQVIREHGFGVPETLITSDPERVVAFRERHGRVIYKSISGVRSIVKTLEEEDLCRLDRIRLCPVQFQAFVEGTNVRVHTIGAEVFATAITTNATDYRYAYESENGATELEEFHIDDELAERCLVLARALELPFAGIDLKLAPDGEVYCFEVNPSPAFSYYESHTGQPIRHAVARYLCGDWPA